MFRASPAEVQMPAKFNLLVAASIPAVALIPLLACGGDSKAKTDSGIVVHDSPGSGGSGSATCSFNSTFTPTFSAIGAGFTMGSGAGGANSLDFDGLFGGTNGSANEQVLRLLIFGGCGTTGTGCGGSAADATPDWPASFAPKSGIDLATAPDAIVILLTDRGATSYQTIYASDMGTLNVTAAANGSGHPFTGNATNVHFVHVDGQLNPAADGCTSTVPSFSFNGSAFDGKVFYAPDGVDRDAVMNYLRHRTMELTLLGAKTGGVLAGGRLFHFRVVTPQAWRRVHT